MNYSNEWEHLDPYTRRLRVPDGWIVHTFTHVILGGKEVRVSEALTFVPDIENDWVIKK